MGLFDSVLSVGGSLLGGLFNNDSASERQEDAQAFNAQQYATRYQTTVKDLEAAGLNPMLAYSQLGGSFASSSPASSAGMPDLGASYLQSKMNSAQVANIAADTENKKAQASLIEAQAAQAWSSAGLQSSQTDQSRAATDEIRQRIENLQAEKLKTNEETVKIKLEQEQLGVIFQKITEEAELARQRGLTETQLRSQMAATIGKIKAETDLTISDNALRTFDIQAAQNLGNLGRHSKEAKSLIDIFRSLMRK